MALCKCGHEQSKHDANGCIGCAARCKRFDASPIITGEERVRRQEIIAAKLRQAQSTPVAKSSEKVSNEVTTTTQSAKKMWYCDDCDSKYDTKKEAQDCCGSEVVTSGWHCAACDELFDTKKEAEECTCESSDDSSDDSSDSGGGIMSYVGAFIGLLIVIIIAVSVVIPTVISSVSASGTCMPGAIDSSTGAKCVVEAGTTGTMQTILSIIPLMIAVVVLLLVVAMIGA